jgi:hypothetical protein
LARRSAPELIQGGNMMKQKIDIFTIIPLSEVMWIKPNIGDILVLKIIWGSRDYWRFVSNGESGMHSHSRAWEREIVYRIK